MNMFTKIPINRPKSSKFDLGHERKFSLRFGGLVPILVQDVVPGDKFRCKTEIMLRFAPMLAPIMHRVNVFTHYFFVPNRLVWDEWEDFITGGRLGDQEPIAPFFEVTDIKAAASDFQPGTLHDYMGMPTVSDVDTVFPPFSKISALPYRGYQLIFDEYYRDQNLTAALDILKTSGELTDPEYLKLTELRQRAWEKDYFTSALPWAQRGGAVNIPLTGTGDVNYYPSSPIVDAATGLPFPAGSNLETDPVTGSVIAVNDGAGNIDTSRIENIDNVTLDSAGVDINELRKSFRLQEWLERNARGGARYIEQILSHFGVQSSDSRLQRPEYLGGGRQPVKISEVLSTFQASDGTGQPQANMAGHAISVGQSNQFSRRFEEHGYVIGLMSVMPKGAYQQGVPRHLSRFDKLDYYWPEFAHLGEQAIKNQELYFDTAGAANDNTFGYTPRYAEYKYQPSTVHGEMKSSLAFWHMGRIFANAPALNTQFVTYPAVSGPAERVFAVPDSEQLYCQLYNNLDAVRPMPYFGVPRT